MRVLSICMLVIGLASFVLGIHGGTLLNENTSLTDETQAIQARLEGGDPLGAAAMEYRTLLILAGGVLMMGGALLLIKAMRRFD